MWFKFQNFCLFILLFSQFVGAEVRLVRYSISSYSKVHTEDASLGILGPTSQVSTKLSVIRVGFRQYSNPYINSSSTLSLDNRLTLMGEEDELVYGNILVYPNPFQLRSGGIITYHLNQPTSLKIQIYDMFGHLLNEYAIFEGMPGGQMGVNKVAMQPTTFNQYDVPAGVYFIFLIDDKNQLIGKSKFAIVP